MLGYTGDFVWSMFKEFFLFVAGMVIYSIVVFYFYKKASKKLLFTLDKENLKKLVGFRKFWTHAIHVLKYLFLSPIIFLVWLIIITVLLLLFTSNTATGTILLIGLALLATIRVTAYFNEDLAVDVAKTLPLSMLAAFLLDVDKSIDLSLFWEKLLLLPSFLPTLVIYFVFIVLLEFALRIYEALTGE